MHLHITWLVCSLPLPHLHLHFWLYKVSHWNFGLSALHNRKCPEVELSNSNNEPCRYFASSPFLPDTGMIHPWFITPAGWNYRYAREPTDESRSSKHITGPINLLSMHLPQNNKSCRQRLCFSHHTWCSVISSHHN